VGYATPGYQNSQRYTTHDSIDTWTLSPICFSPNGDGKDDFVQIQWSNALSSEWVQWCIIDQFGIPVYHQDAEWLGNARRWTWDGDNQDGERCEPGMYGWVVYSSSTQYQILPTLKTFVLSP
jgi:flagellar hook assembly protein FlgD